MTLPALRTARHDRLASILVVNKVLAAHRASKTPPASGRVEAVRPLSTGASVRAQLLPAPAGDLMI